MGGSGRQPSDDHRRRDRDRRSSSAGRDSKHSVWKGGRDRKRSRSPERRRRGSEDRSRSRRRGERDRLDAGGRAAGRDSRGRSGGKERRSRDDGWERARKASSEGGGASARQDDPTSKRARVGHQSASPRSGEGRSARHPVPTRLLSFGDEVEEGSDTDDFSLARSTAHRFAHERTLVLSTPLDYENQGPQLSMKDVSISRESDVMGNVKPSLSAIYLGAHQSRGLRPYMEDRCCLVPNFTPMSRGAPVADGVSRCFVGIYDGHNGVMSADMAAARLHRMLADDPVIRMHTGEGPPAIVRAEEEQITEALKKAFRTLDDEILGESRQEETQDGATALMALTVGEALYMAHAGDSRAVLCRNGKASRLTEDHKPDLPRERNRILKLDGRVDFQRGWRVIVEMGGGLTGKGLAVSRCLGDLLFKEPKRLVECEPDVCRVGLGPECTFVVLGTDGVWDVLSDDDAVAIAGQEIKRFSSKDGGRWSEATSKAASQAVVQAALDKGTADNVSAVVMLFRWN